MNIFIHFKRCCFSINLSSISEATSENSGETTALEVAASLFNIP